MSSDMTQGEGLQPLNDLCAEAAEQTGAPLLLDSPLEMYHPDPMLSGPETTSGVDVLEPFNNFNHFDNSILQDPPLTDFSFQDLSPQSLTLML